ncbi:MTOR-associated protein MEAK7 isoform X3 [Cervus elaphus]|uniref:MTOR-associated protein MEAK7 isoform X3 n=1 Tax=Cervus elaphus TaxID=9860 RepID=UPI001CC2A613|nr:MTOR-associated protein MEAK7 isoform X3 [Cervus elaphus]XP_043754125.1 MTOR-associated protein MEAK7 isoform X3 [Cervus elaphus]XP_043754126.1 MTOR-associated protein MEAK7 isoform X3 [Cervus elaphus]XP_043754127.1 MTOR-associated protein MEAK7 isoform X3 [Cervus elaphus]
MGNSKSHPEQEFSSRFLPGEQAEVNRLFDALSSENLGSSTSHRSFSLQALKARGHVGDALPPEMVTRLFEGMQRVDGSRKAKGPSEHISQKQFTVSMSHLLKGTAEEKSLVILNMISASGGPVKARDVYKFTEDLVGSVVHVLNYRQELRGWSQKPPPGYPSRVLLLAAQLCSEMKLQGGGKLLGPQWLDCDCDEAVLEDWVFRAHQVATFLSLIIHQGFLLLCSTLELAALVPERQVDPQREFASLLDILSVIYINSHLPQERRLRWRLLFATELHGNSFAQLCGRITHRGPCLVLLEDCDGHVFGGFASCSWEVKPQFQGDDRCFLFSVSPRMAVYTCTGYNDHYMYLNQGRKTIPNGLGIFPTQGWNRSFLCLLHCRRILHPPSHRGFIFSIIVDISRNHTAFPPAPTPQS